MTTGVAPNTKRFRGLPKQTRARALTEKATKLPIISLILRKHFTVEYSRLNAANPRLQSRKRSGSVSRANVGTRFYIREILVCPEFFFVSGETLLSKFLFGYLEVKLM